jgi:AraC-like DNA-binding protein
MAGTEEAAEAADSSAGSATARGAASGDTRAFHFSTDTYREHERIAAWRELVGRTLLHLDILPRSKENFRGRARIFRSPTLRVLQASGSVAGQGNSRDLINSDDVSFVWLLSSRSKASQLGRSEILASGDAVLLSHEDLGSLAFQGESRFMAAALPRAILAPLVPDMGTLFARAIDTSNPAQRLLRRHLEHADEDLVAGGEDVRTVFIDHACDLLALALGATRDVAELARGRGLPAARLRAIKDDIRKNCHRPELSLQALATRHGVSARYVQRIFEHSGSTFTQYVAEQRLARAHEALCRHAANDVPISTIALDCGFSDVSHFNRLFRQHYGCTPSDVRKAARSGS